MAGPDSPVVSVVTPAYNAEATITMAFTNTGDVPLSRIDGNTRNADDQGAVGIGCSSRRSRSRTDACRSGASCGG